MKPFEGYKITKQINRKGKYIYFPYYSAKLTDIYIEDDYLIIDLYLRKQNILYFETTIKIGNNYQWWKDGVLQTKSLKLSKIKYPVLVKTQSKEIRIISWYNPYCIMHDYLKTWYRVFGVIDSVQLRIITQPRKKSFKYLPEEYRTEDILYYSNIKTEINNSIVLTDKYNIAIIKDNQIKYYRKIDLIQISFCKLYYYNSFDTYRLLFKYDITTNKNLSWRLYLINNKLNQILEHVLLNQIDLELIMKLSFSKKILINKMLPNLFNSVIAKIVKIKNLNSYRDEDLEKLLQTMNSFYSLDSDYVIINYKKLYNYIEYSPSFYLDYLNLRSRCSHITIKKYPTFPSIDKLKIYHDELVKIYNDNIDIINNKLLIQKNEKYQELKENLKLFEYNNDKYSIIIPDSLQDVINEGKNLHHCVGTYTDAICEKKNKIYFLRKNSELDKSWFTIDVDYDNNIRQIHTYYNKNINNVLEFKELQKFILNWSQEKNLKIKNINDMYCHL